MRPTEVGGKRRLVGIAGCLVLLGAGVTGALLLNQSQPPPRAVHAAQQPRADWPLSAEFSMPGGQLVVLDYLDHRNFRLATEGNRLETLVVDGEIYIHFLASGSQPEELWRYGALKPERPKLASGGKRELWDTGIPAAGVAQWGDVGPVFDTSIKASGPLGIPADATIAEIGSLANAQWRIATELLPAMDMATCGDALQELTSWWDVNLTSEGWAVLATSAGVRLNGPIKRLSNAPGLPAGIDVRPWPFTIDRGRASL